VPVPTTLPAGVDFPAIASGQTVLGVGPGAPWASAHPVLQAAAQQLVGTPPALVRVCLPTQQPAWSAQIGGLYVVWQGDTRETAVARGWGYVGSATGDPQQVVTAAGVSIGSTRQQVLAAYPAATVVGSTLIDTTDAEFELVNDTVTWFGWNECTL
jgi:hypothetical protein